MDIQNQETLYYRYCRTLDGRLVGIDTARRNGRLVPRFSSECLESPCVDGSESGDLDELIAEITQNLTAVERRTWLSLIADDKSILDIAAEEGVSRAAIYERIRGNSKGQGGMVAKNEYVAIWWERRQRQEGQ